MKPKKKQDSLYYLGLLMQVLKNTHDGYRRMIHKINTRMEGKYSPTLIALWSTVFAGLLILFMLFLPNYLGMSDDGSFEKIMNTVGIEYTPDTEEDVFFNYYVKKYAISPQTTNEHSFYRSSLTGIIKIAVGVDQLITRDGYFDMRFLALIYSVLFLMALFMMIKQAARWVQFFSEGVIIGIAGVLIFADVSYMTYFSSFYPEPLMLISFMICIGSLLSFQNKKNEIKYLMLYTLFGVILATGKRENALIVVPLVMICIKQIGLKKALAWRVGCVASAFILGMSMFVSYYFIKSDFTVANKYHAMTRGVLLQSKNPEETLNEFGIAPSYAVLTDANGYDPYPLVKPEDDVLKEGFLDRYTNRDIALYYIKHPDALMGMLDLSVKTAFDVRPSYSGNYEKSVGFLEKAKSPFWSFWSNFKVRSAPRTIGFIILLCAVDIFLFRKKRKNKEYDDDYASIPLAAVLLIFCIGIMQGVITVIYCGDVGVNRYVFLLGVSIDMLCYLTFSRALNKINIIQTGGKRREKGHL